MLRLENTTPHFIRCIKPNNLQSARLYEQGLVLQQLRCCGVLEVVRISRAGFPTRMSHQKFARRYTWLLLTSYTNMLFENFNSNIYWCNNLCMSLLFSILAWDIRYGFLLQESITSQDPLGVSVAILHQFDILPEMYQVGYTKLFFRTGQVKLLSFLWILIAVCIKSYLGFKDFKLFTARSAPRNSVPYHLQKGKLIEDLI